MKSEDTLRNLKSAQFPIDREKAMPYDFNEANLIIP